MEDAVRAFLNFLAVEKNASENTISAYRNDLRQLENFLRQGGKDPSTWDALDQQDLVAFVGNLRERGYRDATVARKVAAVKSFFAFLTAEGELDDDPAEDLKTPQVGKSLPKTLTPEEVDELLEQPSRRDTIEAMRDKAMLELLYATGMRVSELVSLDVIDVALHGPHATVRCIGKGDRERTLPLPRRVVDELRQYLEHIRPRMARSGGEPALFLNRRGDRLTRQGFWLILRNYAKAARIEKPITPHTLRHTFATHMLSHGMSLRHVQEALGHANISTTQIYTQVTEDQKRDAYDVAHPRAS